jgi:hypothetical protein
VAAVLVAVLALIVYRGTLLPGVAFWDTGEFQTVGPVLGTAHPTGFPAYVILGWLASNLLAPLGEPAYRMNVLSALLIASAAAVTVELVRRLTASLWLGMAAGIGVAFNEIAWRLGTHADPHALHLLLVALLLVALVAWQRERADGGGDRWLVVASAIFGVSVANHSLTLLLAAPIGIYVLAVDRWLWRRLRLVLTCAAVLFGTAALLYLELPLRAGPLRAPLVYGTPDTWEGFWYIVLAEQFQGSIVDPLGQLDRKFVDLVDLTVAQFGPLASLIPLGFLVTLLREPRYGLLSGLAAGITVFFSASYLNADITRYYLGPILMAWTWLAILAAAAVNLVSTALAAGRARTAVAPPEEGASGYVPRRRLPTGAALLGSAAAAALALALVAPTALAWDERYRKVDASRDTGGQRWIDATLATLEPDAVVVSWWSYSTPLWYAQHVEGRIPDVFIIDDRTRLDLELGEIDDVIDRYLGRRPVYLIRAGADELQRLGRTYRLEPGLGGGNLVRVASRAAARP